MHVSGDQVAVNHEAGTCKAAARHFFEYDDVKQVVESETAVFLRNGAAQQTRFSGLQPQLPWHHAILFPLRVIRSDLAGNEFSDRLSEYLMFFPKQTAFKHCQDFSISASSRRRSQPGRAACFTARSGK